MSMDKKQLQKGLAAFGRLLELFVENVYIMGYRRGKTERDLPQFLVAEDGEHSET
jgi:hypothetical protein